MLEFFYAICVCACLSRQTSPSVSKVNSGSFAYRLLILMAKKLSRRFLKFCFGVESWVFSKASQGRQVSVHLWHAPCSQTYMGSLFTKFQLSRFKTELRDRGDRETDVREMCDLLPGLAYKTPKSQPLSNFLPLIWGVYMQNFNSSNNSLPSMTVCLMTVRLLFPLLNPHHKSPNRPFLCRLYFPTQFLGKHALQG